MVSRLGRCCQPWCPMMGGGGQVLVTASHLTNVSYALPVVCNIGKSVDRRVSVPDVYS